MTCSVEECPAGERAAGYCPKHYKRQLKHGDPRTVFGRRQVETDPWSAVFSGRYEVQESGCWYWTAGKNASGYGYVTHDGRRWYVHRLSYSLTVGPIEELTVDHLCFRPACIRPDHLQLLTYSENATKHEAPQGRPDVCRNGHQRTEENTVWRNRKGRTFRYCRICLTANNRKATAKYAAKRASHTGWEPTP